MRLLLASILTTAFCAGIKPCLAAEDAELPKTGFAIEARFPLETEYFMDVNYGGGVLIGYRTPRMLFGVGAEFVEQYVPRPDEPGPRYVPSQFRRITVSPTIQFAVARSTSRTAEFCVGGDMPLGVLIQRKQGTNIDGVVNETNYFTQVGLRFSFGPRYWMSPHIAISLPFSLGIMIMQWTPLPTVGVAPSLMGVF